MALGATRGPILQHLLSESFVPSLLGTCFGVLVGYWALSAIVASLAHIIPGWMSFKLDFRWVGFSALLAVSVTGLSGSVLRRRSGTLTRRRRTADRSALPPRWSPRALRGQDRLLLMPWR